MVFCLSQTLNLEELFSELLTVWEAFRVPAEMFEKLEHGPGLVALEINCKSRMLDNDLEALQHIVLIRYRLASQCGACLP